MAKTERIGTQIANESIGSKNVKGIRDMAAIRINKGANANIAKLNGSVIDPNLPYLRLKNSFLKLNITLIRLAARIVFCLMRPSLVEGEYS